MEEREVTSVLDNKASHIYGYPLTITQQIWLHFILPGICFITIFVLNFSLDLGVGIDLILENRKRYGLMTLALLYLPAFGCYLQQLTQPPTSRNCKTISLWLLKETCLFIFFPYRIIKCLGIQLFWIIELIRDKGDQEESLLGYEECFTQPIEMYLFLQIFLQNIPQALFQFYMITIGVSSYDETDIFQSLCSLASLAMAAMGIMRLHRYESQRIGGRKAIWDNPPPSTPSTAEPQDIPAQDPLLPKQTTGLRLPVRRPRIKALEEDNPIGKLLLFLFWFTFLFARTLTITTAMNFHPRIVFGVLVVHFLIMLIYYCWYPVNIFKKVFFSIISTFFIFEVGIKIQKIGYLYFLFIVTTLVEDISFTILWYILSKWDGWWYSFIIYVDINAHVLFLICFAVYLARFKPQVKYIRPPNQNLSNRSSIATQSNRSSVVIQSNRSSVAT